MEATIYKICDSALWREAERAGVFAGAPVDHADGFIHFSTAAQVAETAARHFAGRGDLRPGRGRCGGARSRAALRALARRRIVSASLWHAAALGGALGEAAAARRRRKACVSGACMIALFDHLAAAAAAQARSRGGAWARAQCAQARAAAASGGGRRKAARRGVRPDVSQSGRARGRLRQACRSDRSAVAAGLRLRRGGRRHAEAAAGQSAAAAVPARSRRGRSSTVSASTAMASRRSRSGSRRARALPASSGSISAPTRTRSTVPPTT